jgi:hypothetical protein
MGKKVKKFANKVTKVASLGATDLSGNGWGRKIVDPLGAGTGLLDTLTGAGMKGMSDEAAASAQQQRELLAAMNATAQNANVDLSLNNVPDTEVGGTATGLAAQTTNKRKKQGPGGVAASLGINA